MKYDNDIQMNELCVIFWLVAEFLALAIHAYNRDKDGVHPAHTRKCVIVAGMEQSNKHSLELIVLFY